MKAVYPINPSLTTAFDEREGGSGKGSHKASSAQTITSPSSKKRPGGRIHKWQGDLSLQVCSPLDAVEHYVAAISECRAQNDSLWLAGALDGYACAVLLLNELNFDLEDSIGKDLRTVSQPPPANPDDDEDDEDEDEDEDGDGSEAKQDGDERGGQSPGNAGNNSSKSTVNKNRKWRVPPVVLLAEARTLEALSFYAQHVALRGMELEACFRLARLFEEHHITSQTNHHFRLQHYRLQKLSLYAMRALSIPGLSSRQQLDAVLEAALLFRRANLPRKHALLMYVAGLVTADEGNYDVSAALFDSVAQHFGAATNATAISDVSATDGGDANVDGALVVNGTQSANVVNLQQRAYAWPALTCSVLGDAAAVALESSHNHSNHTSTGSSHGEHSSGSNSSSGYSAVLAARCLATCALLTAHLEIDHAHVRQIFSRHSRRSLGLDKFVKKPRQESNNPNALSNSNINSSHNNIAPSLLQHDSTGSATLAASSTAVPPPPPPTLTSLSQTPASSHHPVTMQRSQSVHGDSTFSRRQFLQSLQQAALHSSATSSSQQQGRPQSMSTATISASLQQFAQSVGSSHAQNSNNISSQTVASGSGSSAGAHDHTANAVLAYQLSAAASTASVTGSSSTFQQQDPYASSDLTNGGMPRALAVPRLQLHPRTTTTTASSVQQATLPQQLPQQPSLLGVSKVGSNNVALLGLKRNSSNNNANGANHRLGSRAHSLQRRVFGTSAIASAATSSSPFHRTNTHHTHAQHTTTHSATAASSSSSAYSSLAATSNRHNFYSTLNQSAHPNANHAGSNNSGSNSMTSRLLRSLDALAVDNNFNLFDPHFGLTNNNNSNSSSSAVSSSGVNNGVADGQAQLPVLVLVTHPHTGQSHYALADHVLYTLVDISLARDLLHTVARQLAPHNASLSLAQHLQWLQTLQELSSQIPRPLPQTPLPVVLLSLRPCTGRYTARGIVSRGASKEVWAMGSAALVDRYVDSRKRRGHTNRHYADGDEHSREQQQLAQSMMLRWDFDGSSLQRQVAALYTSELQRQQQLLESTSGGASSGASAGNSTSASGSAFFYDPFAARRQQAALQRQRQEQKILARALWTLPLLASSSSETDGSMLANQSSGLLAQEEYLEAILCNPLALPISVRLYVHLQRLPSVSASASGREVEWQVVPIVYPVDVTVPARTLRHRILIPVLLSSASISTSSTAVPAAPLSSPLYTSSPTTFRPQPSAPNSPKHTNAPSSSAAAANLEGGALDELREVYRVDRVQVGLGVLSEEVFIDARGSADLSTKPPALRRRLLDPSSSSPTGSAAASSSATDAAKNKAAPSQSSAQGARGSDEEVVPTNEIALWQTRVALQISTGSTSLSADGTAGAPSEDANNALKERKAEVIEEAEDEEVALLPGEVREVCCHLRCLHHLPQEPNQRPISFEADDTLCDVRMRLQQISTSNSASSAVAEHVHMLRDFSLLPSNGSIVTSPSAHDAREDQGRAVVLAHSHGRVHITLCSVRVSSQASSHTDYEISLRLQHLPVSPSLSSSTLAAGERGSAIGDKSKDASGVQAQIHCGSDKIVGNEGDQVVDKEEDVFVCALLCDVVFFGVADQVQVLRMLRGQVPADLRVLSAYSNNNGALAAGDSANNNAAGRSVNWSALPGRTLALPLRLRLLSSVSTSVSKGNGGLSLSRAIALQDLRNTLEGSTTSQTSSSSCATSSLLQSLLTTLHTASPSASSSERGGGRGGARVRVLGVCGEEGCEKVRQYRSTFMNDSNHDMQIALRPCSSSRTPPSPISSTVLVAAHSAYTFLLPEHRDSATIDGDDGDGGAHREGQKWQLTWSFFDSSLRRLRSGILYTSWTAVPSHASTEETQVLEVVDVKISANSSSSSVLQTAPLAPLDLHCDLHFSSSAPSNTAAASTAGRTAEVVVLVRELYPDSGDLTAVSGSGVSSGYLVSGQLHTHIPLVSSTAGATQEVASVHALMAHHRLQLCFARCGLFHVHFLARVDAQKRPTVLANADANNIGSMIVKKNGREADDADDGGVWSTLPAPLVIRVCRE